jgi:hypothetical protein
VPLDASDAGVGPSGVGGVHDLAAREAAAFLSTGFPGQLARSSVAKRFLVVDADFASAIDVEVWVVVPNEIRLERAPDARLMIAVTAAGRDDQ